MKNMRTTTYCALVTILGLISAAVVISQAKVPNLSAVISESDTNECGYMVNCISSIESLYFDCGNLKPLHFADAIYRKFIPETDATLVDFEEALFNGNEEITKRIEVDGWSNSYKETLGNLICPVLYSNNLVNCSDEDIIATCQKAGFDVTVSQATNLELSVRVINLSLPAGKQYLNLDKMFFTFVQMWSDDFIWVQPLAEKSRDEIFAETIIGDIDCKNLYLVLEGVRQENRYAYSYREPRKVCVKENKRHPFSQELEQKNNLIERM